MGARHSGMSGLKSHHLVIWFNIIRPECIGLIRNFKGKGLIVNKKDINTFNTPYLR